jgi:hypothetical protein
MDELLSGRKFVPPSPQQEPATASSDSGAVGASRRRRICSLPGFSFLGAAQGDIQTIRLRRSA